MDQKNKPRSFLDMLEQMKNTLGAARKKGGDIEERQKSLTEQQSGEDVAKDEEAEKDEKEPSAGG